MAVSSKKALALLEVFLLLSVSPIAAHRASEVEAMATGLGSIQDLGDHELVREELERAFQEDVQDADSANAANGTYGFIGEMWATCDQRRKLFEDRIADVKKRYDQAMGNGHVDAAEATWVVLKARHAAKTLEGAQRKDCAWVTKGSGRPDMAAMQALLAETSPRQPCYGAAKQQLEDAKDKGISSQKKAFFDALGTLLSKTSECKSVEAEEPSDEDIAKGLDRTETLEDEEEEAIEMAYDAGQYEREKLKKLRSKGAVVLMDKTPQLAGEASWLEGSAESGLFLTAEMDFAAVVSQVITFVVPVIMWIIECQVLTDVIVMVVGLILCVFKQLTVSFVSLFSGSAGDFVFNDCTKFWLGAMWKKEKQQEAGVEAKEKEEGSGTGMGVAVCAARIMATATKKD